ncbi:MAG: c-type cytochrome [Nitrospinae bacterium]|nr:c-type cytochrome [Nitrospinota bacterium]
MLPKPRSALFFLSLFLLTLAAWPMATAQAQQTAPKLSPEEWDKAKHIYFNLCTGCHGTLRKGATGPNLLPKKTLELGTETLEEIIFSGTPAGMPNWGEQGALSKEETNLMARFVQNEPVAPPEMSLEDMKATWTTVVPVKSRPTKPMHTRNWQNYFGVVERDAGRIAIIDGDTKEIITRVPSGYATHILRSSASGRYFLSIGRDGKVGMIDLWMEKPTLVATVKTCAEARSVDASKYKGFEDKLIVVGCYWPPHLVVLDGQTLEPKKIVSTRGYTYDTFEYHPEPRVAAIVSSHYSPEWVVNVKETGYVWLVDYSNIDNLKISMIEAERFLHDGGWDSTHRYFMPAANMKDTMVVIDTKERKRVAKFMVGTKPHPGRGANWVDPKFGPVHGTVHIGEGLLSVWGTDPAKHPESAWKVVRSIALEPGAGSLFVKTHPKSTNLWLDFTLNTDVKNYQSLCVLDVRTLEQKAECIKLTEDPKARVVHMEYNKPGDEVWVSVWGKEGEVVVFDDKTRKIKTRIKGLTTPTGKFNVYNTMHDIY